MIVVNGQSTDPAELQALRDQLTKLQSTAASVLSTATSAKKRVEKLLGPPPRT